MENTRLFPLTYALLMTLSAWLMARPAMAAPTPGAAIYEEYVAKSSPAIAKLQATLSRQVASISAQLLRQGDTAGVETVTAQLKERMAAQPVSQPHAAIATLFNQYDAALERAVQPFKTAALARIDAMLASGTLTDPAAVAELAQVQARINGKLPEAVKQETTPASTAASATSTGFDTAKTAVVRAIKGDYSYRWSYHLNATARIMAVLTLSPDRTWTLIDVGDGSQSGGTWEEGGKNELRLTTNGVVWQVAVAGNEAEITRPDIGKRYLKVLAPQEAERLLAKISAKPASAKPQAHTSKPAISRHWTYHVLPDQPPVAEMLINEDGTWFLLVKATSKQEVGCWKATSASDVISLTYGGNTGDMKVENGGRTASMHRPDSGLRHLKAMPDAG